MTINLNYMRIVQATRYALVKHEGQQRKSKRGGKFVHYMVHPLEVAQILIETGCDNMEVIQAALLHDVLEDTETNPMTLRKKFGDFVVDLVVELTDEHNVKGKARKDAQLRRGPRLSRKAAAIKVADKTSNMRDLLRLEPGWSPSAHKGYITHAAELVRLLPCNNEELLKVFWNAHRDGMKLVEKMEEKKEE